MLKSCFHSRASYFGLGQQKILYVFFLVLLTLTCNLIFRERDSSNVAISRRNIGLIECNNGNRSTQCLRDGRQVFFPFSFIEEMFEVYGKFSVDAENNEIFSFEHSKGVVRMPLGKYSALGTHLDNLYAFVEGRPWVIFVDGKEGVPLCRQWFPDGFFFSTNIAQFGLSHYSQYSVQPPPTVMFIDVAGANKSDWVMADKTSTLNTEQRDGDANDAILCFKTVVKEQGISLPINGYTSKEINAKKLYFFTVDFKFTEGSSIVVHLERKDDHQSYHIHYVCNDTRLVVNGNHIVIGLGKRDAWTRLTRNLVLDLEQGIFARDDVTDGRVQTKRDYISKINGIELQGEGSIRNMTLSSREHLPFVMAAAEWVLRNQDDKGGWPMPVSRELGTDILQPGWYSALGQGVCISLLARAYGVTKDERYLEAAMKGTKLFSIPSEDGGVKAVFMDKYVWYEEYPTQPPSFVLNGFMISLFGLYDLATTAPSPKNEESKRLFEEGKASLKVLLPLYDSGKGTLYDLRHVTMKVQPNICRWDYHNLHTLLLENIYTIDNDTIFRKYADRWHKYKLGYKGGDGEDQFM